MKMMHLLYPDPFTPFTYTGDHGPAGIVIDRLSAAFSKINLIPHFIPADHDNIISRLKKGHGNVIACLASNQERRKTLLFSNEIVQTGGAIFCPLDDDPASDPASFAGKIIATPESGPLAAHIHEKWPEVSILPVMDYPEALESVIAGKACAAALNIHAGIDITQKDFHNRFHQPEKTFISLSLAVCGLLGSSEPFIEKINQGLESAP
jgi:polar amino acid transport system substrate-binding protein